MLGLFSKDGSDQHSGAPETQSAAVTDSLTCGAGGLLVELCLLTWIPDITTEEDSIVSAHRLEPLPLHRAAALEVAVPPPLHPL